MKLPPAATYASRTANAVRSSMVRPKTLLPRQSGVTSKFERPSLRFTMDILLLSMKLHTELCICMYDSSISQRDVAKDYLEAGYISQGKHAKIALTKP